MIPQALDIKPCDDGTADFKLLELHGLMFVDPNPAPAKAALAGVITS